MSESSAIKTISAGSNCFLVKTGTGFVLVDTGVASKRSALEKELESSVCEAGDLTLIVLTHGDSDHAGNAAFLRKKYGAPIAMHRDDAGMVERGDMSSNRKVKPDRITTMGRVIMLMGRIMTMVKPATFECFSPDVYLQDGQTLAEYGCDAQVLHLPAHSKGSIGVLTANGDLICGDFIYNFFGPNQVWIDDLTAARTGVERLKTLSVRTVYPGHGKPFPWETFVRKRG
jgi:glyoxylase-like metal-dependent hydrolase (beta-lactamase superfamily II)